jgi:hypothetical protein
MSEHDDDAKVDEYVRQHFPGFRANGPDEFDTPTVEPVPKPPDPPSEEDEAFDGYFAQAFPGVMRRV